MMVDGRRREAHGNSGWKRSEACIYKVKNYLHGNARGWQGASKAPNGIPCKQGQWYITSSGSREPLISDGVA